MMRVVRKTDGQGNERASSVVVLGHCEENFPASGLVPARGLAPGNRGSAPHRLDVNLRAGEEEIPPGAGTRSEHVPGHFVDSLLNERSKSRCVSAV